MKIKLDDTDKTILRILQENGKLTTKEIAAQLHLTVTPVYERIKRLEKNGAINRYVALVNGDAVGIPMTAFCNVLLKEHSKEFLKKFEKDITKLKEVISCYHIAGNFDYLLKIVVKDMTEYQDFIMNKLAALDNIGNVQSSFVMTEVKRSTAIPI